MDVLINKVDEIQSDLIKIKKCLKTLTQRQKLHEMKSFTIDKSEYEVCNLQPKNLISNM
jgi:hypothetical protein